MSSDRTGEIWSTRIQQELLTLITEPTGDDVKDRASILPPFVQIQDHALNIAEGSCTVSFRVQVDRPTSPLGNDKSGPETPTENATTSSKETVEVFLTLDASMSVGTDGTVDTSRPSYPFQPPSALLVKGAEYLPMGSDIENGSSVEIDCDWTPSLQLMDAILNVSLKIKESIRTDEPFQVVTKKNHGTASPSMLDKSFSNFVSTVNASVTSVNASIKKIADDASATAAATAAAAAAATQKQRQNLQNQRQKLQPQPSPQRRVAKSGDVRIGDSIDLSDEPWNSGAGMYSCRAIRRPDFVEKALNAAAEEEKKKQALINKDEDEDKMSAAHGNYMKLNADGIRKVAGVSFAGAGSVLRSVARQARSVLEESFLLITDKDIVEFKANKFNIGMGTVTYAIPISHLAKLKFRRQESISLFFKQAPDDPFIFMCPESAECVQKIQSVLKRHGVKGKHTNATMQRSVQAAIDLAAEIQRKEKSLKEDPSVEKVNEIMDLYRQAAEKFETAGDARHEEVMNHMHKFLAKPMTASILDGSFVKPEPIAVRKVSDDTVPQGEIIEMPSHNFDDEYDEEKKKSDDFEFQKTMKQADDILEEAKRDMENFGNFDDVQTSSSSLPSEMETAEGKDTVAELDAMLTAADKELSDIMNA